MQMTLKNKRGKTEGWKHGRKRSLILQSATFPIFLFAFMFIFSTAYGAPDVPLNFDGWVTDALAKLETDGITGGFHRHTAPPSRSEVAQIIKQAEYRIRTGAVTPSAIDKKLLEKLKREFTKETLCLVKDGASDFFRNSERQKRK